MLQHVIKYLLLRSSDGCCGVQGCYAQCKLSDQFHDIVITKLQVSRSLRDLTHRSHGHHRQKWPHHALAVFVVKDKSLKWGSHSHNMTPTSGSYGYPIRFLIGSIMRDDVMVPIDRRRVCDDVVLNVLFYKEVTLLLNNHLPDASILCMIGHYDWVIEPLFWFNVYVLWADTLCYWPAVILWLLKMTSSVRDSCLFNEVWYHRLGTQLMISNYDWEL